MTEKRSRSKASCENKCRKPTGVNEIDHESPREKGARQRSIDQCENGTATAEAREWSGCGGEG
uniref:Uncharacterized protein n=1 Tax=Anopheles atroparvus TaxID=41427 RepID=A0AAG5DPU5_ANOAO